MSSGDDAGKAEEEFELFVRLSSGNRLRLRGNGLAADSTVAAAKAAIEALLPDAPAGSQRLIYKGRILDDDSSGLSQFGVVHQSTLFLVVSRGAAEATTSPSNQSGKATAIPASTAAIPSTIAPPAAATVPASAAPTAPSPSTAPASTNLSSDRLQQLLQNAMSDQQPRQQPRSSAAQQRPGFPGSGAQTNLPGSMDPWMQRLLGDMDPNFLAGLMQTQLESNPALQRLMDENPHLRHMMTDPAALQQAANMLRNPEAMQQAMRQQDLALSQLENMPGGFAALSSMYQNMQAPLEESLSTPYRPDATSGSASASSQHSDEGAAGTAMPNPWGTSSSSTTTSRNAVGRTTMNPSRGAGNPFLEGLLASRGSPGAPPMPNLPSLSTGLSSRRLDASNNPWANLGSSSGAPTGGTSPATNAPSTQPPPVSLRDSPFFRVALQMAREHPDQLRELIMSDPSHRAMFGDNMSPEMFNQYLDMALDPNVMEMLMQFEGLTGADRGGFPSPLPPGDLSALMSAALRNPGMAGQPPRPGDGGAGLDFSALLQGMAGGAPVGPGASFGGPSRMPPPSNPRDRYRRQLQQLSDMGFDHEDSCLAALQAEHGNLNRAVDRLLSSPPSAAAAAAAVEPVPPQLQPSSEVDSSGGAVGAPDEATSTAEGGAEDPPAPPKDAADKKND